MRNRMKTPYDMTVSQEYMAKAFAPKQKLKLPPKPVFNEAKLNRILDKADRLGSEASAIQERWKDVFEMHKTLQRQHDKLVSQSRYANDKASEEELSDQISLIDKELKRSGARLNQITEERDSISKQAAAARGLANRLSNFAAQECGWQPISETPGRISGSGFVG